MNTTTAHRVLAAAAAAGVLSLGTALPASAWPDPGAQGSSGQHEPSTGGSTPVKTVRNTPSTTVVREVVVDDDAVEYLQIALGALTGMALAGVAVVGLRRWEHHTPHPA